MGVETAAKPIQHLQYIDSLRGLAVAAVIAVHTAGFIEARGWLDRVTGVGQRGVQLFYVISAFTLVMSMKKRNPSEDRPHLYYSIRRLFRIAPAFYLVLWIYYFIGVGVIPLPAEGGAVSIRQTLGIMSFLNGWRPDLINWPFRGQWSIAVEMMFYVLLPFIFPFLTSFRRAVSAWWMAVLISIFSRYVAVRVAGLEGFPEQGMLIELFGDQWLPTQLPIFMSGVGLYFLIKERLDWKMCVLPYLPGLLLLGFLRYHNPPVGLLPAYGVAMMAGVAILARHPSAWLVNNVTAMLGRVSFSAYLLHSLVLMVMGELAGVLVPIRISNGPSRFLVVYCIAMVLTFGLSLLTWRWIEEPGQQAGRYLIKMLSKRAAVSRAAVS